MCNSYYKDENIYIRMKNCLIIFYFISEIWLIFNFIS